jgi:serine protease Do
VLGETGIAIGNPSGKLPGSVSDGVISYIDREVNISEVGEMQLFQHVASIDHGSSGGGLFNLYGELIGITNAGNDAYNNIFYAIPYQNLTTEKDNGFITVAKQLISSKTATNYGYVSGRWMLGITIVERTDQFGATYVSISEVVPNSNAAAAGFAVGDILTAVTYIDENGEKVMTNVTSNNSFSGVVSAIKKHYTIGDTFTISIKRLEGRQFKYYDKEITLSNQLIFCDTGK